MFYVWVVNILLLLMGASGNPMYRTIGASHQWASGACLQFNEDGTHQQVAASYCGK